MANTSGNSPRRKGSLWSVFIPALLFIVAIVLLLYFLVFAPGRGMRYINFSEADVRLVEDPDNPGEEKPEGDLVALMSNELQIEYTDNQTYKTNILSVNIQQSAYSDNIYYVSGTFRFSGEVVPTREVFGFQATLPASDVAILEQVIDDHPEIYSTEAANPVFPDRTVQSTNSVWSWLWPVIYIVLGGILIFILLRSMSRAVNNNGVMNFNKSTARRETQSKVRFSDVAGCDEVKDELREVVEYFHSNDKYKKMGAVLPKGILLVGPPGTGKTLLAKAVAGEASVPFFSISGSDFVEMYVGVGAGRVRDLCNTAKKQAPCLIFIDEIDAVGRQRGAGLGGGNDEREQTLNQLLVEMDGFAENSGVIVMAATNRDDVLDPALLRPGRFDRTITVDYPDKEGREAILKVHSRKKPLAPDVDFASVASRTVGFSGADLANVMNEAAIMAVRNKRDHITMMDIDEAIDRRIAGPAKKTHMNEDDKRRVAFHESGHAIVGLTLPGADKVQSVSIIPRGRTGGHTLMTPEVDHFNYTKEMMIARICGYLGGRVSEEVFFGDMSTGASDDFQKATRIARSMVTEYGMSSLGTVQYEDPNQNVFLGRDYNQQRNFSDQVAYEIDQEIRKIIDECYRKTREIVESHKDQVTLIANALFEKETITAAEIAYLLEHGQLPHYDEAKSAEAVAVSDAFAQYQPRNVNNITLIPEYVQFYREVDDIVSHGLKHLVICASTPTSGPMDASQFRSQVTAAFPDGQVGVLFITPNEMKGISATVDTVAQHLEKYSGCSTLLVLTNEESLEAIKQIIRAL